MKKIIILSTCLLLICGCNTNDKNDTEYTNTTSTTTTTKVIETYKDNNPITIGIYNWNNANTKRYLVKDFESSWNQGKDITTFNVFYTQNEEIDGTRIPICFDKYSNNYENIENYRIGYQIEFETKDTKFNKTILKPSDPDEFFDYLEIYLYDGYHRKAGEWYSHTTDEEMNEETLLTGIKLTAGKKINDITSNIKLTAFTYDDENDFKDNYYRGISKYTINVIKK